MYATNCSYGDEMLSDYGCMIGSFNSSNGADTVSSGSDVTFETVSVPKNDKFKYINSKYENVYSTTFQIVKSTCGTEKYFNSYEEGRIQRWLVDREEPLKFKVDQPEFYDSYFMGKFTAKKINVNGQTAGFELTFYADAPFGYKDFDEVSASLIGDNNHTLTIYDISDKIGILCPNFTIKVEENGDLSIENSMDTHILTLKGCVSGEEITLDSENGIITSSVRTNEQLGVDGVFNYYYPSVINTYYEQENIYTFSLDCDVTFNYTPIKKCGL